MMRKLAKAMRTRMFFYDGWTIMGRRGSIFLTSYPDNHEKYIIVPHRNKLTLDMMTDIMSFTSPAYGNDYHPEHRVMDDIPCDDDIAALCRVLDVWQRPWFVPEFMGDLWAFFTEKP